MINNLYQSTNNFMKTLPKVVIIGRANVGKSSLLNRLIEQQKAIISPIAGTTRDTNIGQAYWRGINFDLIDTGGLETIIPSKKIKRLSPALNKDYGLDIVKKTQSALQQADLILFVVDVQTGLVPQDKEIAKGLRKTQKPILLVTNKLDSLRYKAKGTDFDKLGFKSMIGVSALNGLGTGDLLDEIVIKLKKSNQVRKSEKFEIPNPVKITLLGKPNVGKSSLLNSLLGEERVIVSPLPFTTREAVDTYLQYENKNLIIVDTAGIRKQAKIKPGLEEMATAKSLVNAKTADVCLLLIDISEPITIQDNKLTKILTDARVSIVIVANKWDLIEGKTDKSQEEFKKYIYHHFPYLTWAPIIFISAKTGKNTHRVLDLALEVYQARTKTIPQAELDIFLKQALKKHRPAKNEVHRFPKLHEIRQVRTDPPRFELQVGKFDKITFGYLKYLENSLREKFDLIATPLGIEIIH